MLSKLFSKKISLVIGIAFVLVLFMAAAWNTMHINTLSSVRIIKQIMPWHKNDELSNAKSSLMDVPVRYSYNQPANVGQQSTIDASKSSENQQASSSKSKGDQQSTERHITYQPISMNTDIVVYGGGASGTMAAYQAAVLGKQVVLIEPTEWLGGQGSAAGVGPVDSGLGWLDMQLGAIGRWLNYVNQIYKSRHLPADQVYAQCHWDPNKPPKGHICVDPYIANLAFKRLISSPETGGRVQVLYRTDIFDDYPLLKQSGKITGIKVRSLDGKQYTIRSKVVVDASEYGDLIPYSGAAFTFRHGPWFHNRNSAIAWATSHDKSTSARIQDITYVADMRLINSYLPITVKSLYRTKIQDVYPSLYPSGQLLQDLQSKIGTGTAQDACAVATIEKINTHPWGYYFHARYRALGDPFISHTKTGVATCRDNKGNVLKFRRVSKFDINYTNDIPAYALFLLDRSIRQQEICKAKKLTLQTAAYLEKVPLPSGQQNNWYLAKENHTCDSPNCYILQQSNCADLPDDLEKVMYLIPYVRESIRPAGLINTNTNNPVLRWNQITRFRNRVNNPFGAIKADSVSIAAYGFDLHDDSDNVSDVVGKTLRKSGPYQLPLGIFIPTDGQKGHPNVIKGFLVAEKNLAVDRYIQGSLRVHPYAMLNGQVSGVLASLAADYNGDTSRIKPAVVQDIIASSKVKGKMSPWVYSDIDYSHFSPEYRYSELMSTLGIFMGNGVGHPYYSSKWLPHRLINRAEMAVVLQRIAIRLGVDLSSIKIRSYHNNFTDIRGSWCENAVKQLYEAGVINGCTETKFCPANPVTFNQEIAFLYRIIKNRPGALNQRVNCTNIELPRAVGGWIRSNYIALIKAGLLPVQKINGVCKVKFFIDKCGNNYNNCNVPGQSMNRVDTGRLVWDMYYGLNK